MTSLLKKCLAVSASVMVLTGASALAANAPEPWDPNYEPPRLSDGTPDFSGVWDQSSMTGIDRPANFEGLVVPPEQAQAIAQSAAARREASNAPTDPNAPAPPAGSNPGGYNAFYIDAGDGLGVVNGEYRSSWIVDPADGQLPYSEEGRAEMEEAVALAWHNYDNPENRSAAERCTVGYGSTGIPPMLNVLYNNHVQFFQDPNGETISILVEMNHNARIVRMNAEHREDSMDLWMGDSIGRWEGDTLVVETTNFHPDVNQRSSQAQRFYLQEDTLVEERFTRVADDTMFYEFSVTDPDLFTQTWKAEMPMKLSDQPIYEYACHEGNHSLPGILAGARRKESEAALAAAGNAGGTQP
ncbi:MAG: hypothetical protein CMK09_02860 [Ponticaulis sp.]|nr:hypothetical protein [Ponticaulis sp.]|tara:strand:+ start:2362 stop:3429 length:1068 start_codon:yes stop_codon:yes gene_type:complete